MSDNIDRARILVEEFIRSRPVDPIRYDQLKSVVSYLAMSYVDNIPCNSCICAKSCDHNIQRSFGEDFSECIPDVLQAILSLTS